MAGPTAAETATELTSKEAKIVATSLAVLISCNIMCFPFCPPDSMSGVHDYLSVSRDYVKRG